MKHGVLARWQPLTDRGDQVRESHMYTMYGFLTLLDGTINSPHSPEARRDCSQINAGNAIEINSAH